MVCKQAFDAGRFLQELSPYSSLAADELARLTEAARMQQFERGNMLFEQGEICRGVHIVISGQIKLAFCSAQGVEKVVGILTPGEGVGEACMSIGQHYPINAEALTDGTLLFLPQSVLVDCLASNHAFAQLLMVRIAEKLHVLLQDMEATSLLSGTERIVSFLMRQLSDKLDCTQATIRLGQPKSVIASRLSLTQEHFSRLLRQLSEQGMIVVEGRHIRVPDVPRLQRYLESGAGHCVNRSGRSAGRGRERSARRGALLHESAMCPI